MSRLVTMLTTVSVALTLLSSPASAASSAVPALTITKVEAPAPSNRADKLGSAVLGGALGLGVIAVASGASWGETADEMGLLRMSARAVSSAVASTLGVEEAKTFGSTLLTYSPEAGVGVRTPAVDVMTLPTGDFVVFVSVMSGTF